MEDRHAGTWFEQGGKELWVFGVFDGHNGASIAEHCARSLPTHVARVLYANATDVGSVAPCLRRAFLEVDDHAAAQGAALQARETGSTACVAVVTATNVWVANAGDSRAFIRTAAGQIVPMSEDHKPSCPAERDRIIRAGGFVTYPDGVARVHGRLSLSRSMGDRALRPSVVCTPDVRHWPRSTNGYMIIASDGVWDVLSNQEVAAEVDGAVRTHGDVGAALRGVLDLARMKGSGDNITIMHVTL